MASSCKDTALRLRAVTETAIKSIGLGYDISEDLRLKYCKRRSRIISVDEDRARDIVVPGGILVRNVPKFIKCDKGERMRFSSDVLSFQQMSEQFNQELSLSSKIPTGHFNAAFEFSGCWKRDAADTKALAFDGVFITLYSIALDNSHVAICDHIKQAVPSSWDPPALSKFIETYGTHVIVGVKMGGKDVVYVKQQHASPLQPADLQKRLNAVADKRFSDDSTLNENISENQRDITFSRRRRGGSCNRNLPHYKWCQTVHLQPEAISLSFIPISSLLNGIDGSGFLSHAINLYLRYKPPIEELEQFLEFQLPRQWAPVFGDLPLGPDRKQPSGASLNFSFMGSRVYVNTNLVDVGKRPVTGLRLYLEGKKSNCLAVHLQHLSSSPKSFQLKDVPNDSPRYSDQRYYEKLKWRSFTHVCTAPVESDDELSIVTGCQLEVKDSGLKKVLSLRLCFSRVDGAIALKKPEWDSSPVLTHKSGFISSIIISHFSSTQNLSPQLSDVNVNSAEYPGGPPVPAQITKLLRFINTTEMKRGPQDPPGYWVVSGARLVVDKGRISLCVKFSLLALKLPDDVELNSQLDV